MSPHHTPAPPEPLGLFPLQTVLFPDGLLPLQVFEARYLDLIGTCLRKQQPFGVVALRKGSEVRPRPGSSTASDEAQTEFETVGVLAEPQDVESTQAGLLRVQCRGTQRFKLITSRQEGNGLWVGDVELMPAEARVPVPVGLRLAAERLERALALFEERGQLPPVAKPYRFEDAAWVAHRWCELLPIDLASKQALLVMPDVSERLHTVHDFLIQNGVLE